MIKWYTKTAEGEAGADLGLVRPQATVIEGPQPPHTPTLSIILLKCY